MSERIVPAQGKRLVLTPIMGVQGLRREHAAQPWRSEPGDAPTLAPTTVGAVPPLQRAVRGLEHGGCYRVVGLGRGDLVRNRAGRADEAGLDFAEDPRHAPDHGVSVMAAPHPLATDTLESSVADHLPAFEVMALVAGGVMVVPDIGDGFWRNLDTPEIPAHAERELAPSANDPS